MRPIILAFFISVIVLSGCVASQGSAKDSRVDSELVIPGLPGSAPQAGPGEPQVGFDQEVIQSQNP